MTTLWLMLAAFSAMGLLMLVARLYSAPVRNIGDLVALLQPTDEAELEKLLDPEEEGRMRALMSAQEFRDEQRIRIYRLYQILRHRAYNQRLITAFAFAEYFKLREARTGDEKERQLLAKETVREGMLVRNYMMSALATLRVWIIFRADQWPFMSPMLSELREAARVDGMYTYYRLVSAMGYLTLLYGHEWHHAFLAKLRGPLPLEE